MSERDWQPIKTVPTTGDPFLAWQVIIADELDEDDAVIAKDQRLE